MKTFLFVTIIIFVLAGAVFVFILVYSPKKTTLTEKEKQLALGKLLGRDPILTEKVRASGSTVYDGNYITFSIPKSAEDYPYDDANVKGSTFVVESKEFMESNPRYHFIVQVIKQSSDVQTYDDVPSVRLRRTQTDVYHESGISISNQKGIAFVSQADGYEKDAFLLSHGLLYTFVITGGNPKIEPIFSQVVNSAKIKFLISN